MKSMTLNQIKNVLHAFAGFLVITTLFGCENKIPPSIIIIMADTLRADHLGCYGFSENTSPNIDKLAREGVLFHDLATAAPSTAPSVASVLTGVYPDEIGVHKNCDILQDRAILLSERLKNNGYATGAIISNPVLNSVYGFDQGFDHYCMDFKRDPTLEEIDAPEDGTLFKANVVTNAALEWIKTTPEPFFLYVHYMDPHSPYLPPYKFRDQMLGGVAPLEEYRLRDVKLIKKAAIQGQTSRLEAQYNGEIAFMDQEIGRLIKGLPLDILLVLTGDHGEGFMEHNKTLHANSLYQELVHTPLIVRWSTGPKNLKINTPVSHVDIAPTILDFAGLYNGKGFSGKSLLPMILDQKLRQDSRIFFSILKNHNYNFTMARQGKWKLIWNQNKDRKRLFNLEEDPEEKLDLSFKNPQIISPLVKSIQSRKKRILPPLTLKKLFVGKKLREQLQGLGY